MSQLQQISGRIFSLELALHGNQMFVHSAHLPPNGSYKRNPGWRRSVQQILQAADLRASNYSPQAAAKATSGRIGVQGLD